MNEIMYKSGILQPSDRISLARGLILRGRLLIDSSNGANHQLSMTASKVILEIQKPVHFSELVNKLASRDMSLNQITYVVNFLESIGGLDLRRTLVSNFKNQIHRLNMLGHLIRLDKPINRFTGDLRGLFRAIMCSLKSLVLAMLFSGIVLCGNNIPFFIILMSFSMFLICLFLSTLLHEYVHLYIAKDESTKPVVLQKGTRIGILHKQLTPKKEITSAILGPMVGIVSASAFALVSLYDFLWFGWIIATLVSILHSLSWLPYFGDGIAILSNRKRLYHA